ncbi:hypothetical protein [Oceanicaulis sp.]|uniref:hypothetical protein n=1 Tax=Oceanicaulis sp. TaxID=1924941 RepID=UPI003D297097
MKAVQDLREHIDGYGDIKNLGIRADSIAKIVSEAISEKCSEYKPPPFTNQQIAALSETISQIVIMVEMPELTPPKGVRGFFIRTFGHSSAPVWIGVFFTAIAALAAVGAWVAPRGNLASDRHEYTQSPDATLKVDEASMGNMQE